MFFTKSANIDTIQTDLLNLGESGCLFMCYLWWNNPTRLQHILWEYQKALSKKYIQSDCTVLDGSKIVGAPVSKSTVFPKKACIAKYQYTSQSGNTYGHWVVVDSQHNIIFNSLKSSNCVKYGFSVDYRIPSKEFRYLGQFMANRYKYNTYGGNCGIRHPYKVLAVVILQQAVRDKCYNWLEHSSWAQYLQDMTSVFYSPETHSLHSTESSLPTSSTDFILY